jgi:subtilisin family serine protease
MLGRSKLEFSLLHSSPALIGALFALTLIAPTGAAAETPEPTALTPELATLATPAVASEPPAAQAEAIGLPAEGPGSLIREGERVVVEAHFEGGALSQEETLEAAGAKVLTTSGEYQTVVLSVEPEDLEALAEVSGLRVVTPSRNPVFYGIEGSLSTAVATPNCEGGSVISQGVAQLNVPAARAAFGLRGAGQTIGVISDTFNSATEVEGQPIASRAAGDEATNDLPGPLSSCVGQQVPVRVIAEAPVSSEVEPTDEGRAMLQVIHDVAPEAQLAFATAYSSELEFAQNIERLAAPVAAGGAGATVIVDDVAYPTEPFFQEGPVAVAIQRVTTEGVTYLTAAGNDNLIEAKTNNEIASWEAPSFRATSCPPEIESLFFGPPSCMGFDPETGHDATFTVTVEGHRDLTVDLQWAEAWYGVETDLNAYLLNEAGQVISTSKPLVNYKSGKGTVPIPFEELTWENKTGQSRKVQLVIGRCSGSCDPLASSTGAPRLKFVLAEDGAGVSATEYPRSEGGDVVGPTVFGHAGSAAAITLGAIPFTESATAPREPESYSSRGPVTHYFGPVTSIAPAAAFAAPEALRKPNLTATDCASTTFFAQLIGGAFYFCGTSEAAPHAAAVAALMRQLNPVASPAAINAAMEASATKYTTVTSPEAVGAGLLNAAAAMSTLGPPPPPPAPEPTPPTPEVKITKGPKAISNQKRPTFEFTSSVSASFSCQMNGGAAQSCSSPYKVPSALGDGSHSFNVTATAGGRSGSSAYAFKIDTKAPKVKIAGHPGKVVRTKKRSVVARFKLKASGGPVTFYCKVDREARRACGKKLRHRFKRGKHELKVWAKDRAGNSSAKPVVFRFQVKGIRRSRSPR